MPEETTNVDDILKEMDAILAEEDPNFLKELSEIKIDNAMVELSLMDQALADQDGLNSSSAKPWQIIKKLFNFKDNAKMLIPFWLLISLVVGTVVLTLKNKNWNKPDSLFLTSFAEWGLVAQSYNPMTESEMFFDNSRLLKKIVTVKKMVANIKPSESSGPNPMLAIELNIEGMSSEVIVEIKDREAEFKDLILRVAEEESYDNLIDIKGKQNLAERILNVINANLTQGQIRKVLYKSFILKN
jgi:flagellar basal body-associated protein FliL